jgi:hypothetical protein
MEGVVITAGIPAQDSCPILTRIKAFITAQGVPAMLQHTFRNPQGKPLNLTADAVESGTSEISEAVEDSGVSETAAGVTITLQIAEYDTGSENCIHTVTGRIDDAAGGVVTAPLPEKVYTRSGIYTLTWTAAEGGLPVYVNNGILSVERNLLAPRAHRGEGPPTLNEIRMAIMDSSAAENVLLDGVEFSDDQILLAIVKPLQYFNETNPPIDFVATTRNFPWREHWTIGIIAQLHLMAAANYRRNVLMVNTGGMTIADKAKEKEYLTAYMLYNDQWKDFTLKRKVAINMGAGFGSLGSNYT